MSSQNFITSITRVDDGRVVVVQVRLMREEAVPEVLAGHRIEGPVRLFGVGEDDPRLGKLLVGVAPDVELPLGRSRRRVPGALEPRVLVRRVVDHQLDQHLDVPGVGGRHERLEVLERAVAGVHAPVVGDVVAVVFERRREERQDPQAGDAEPLQVIELLGDPREVADAVVVAVEERPDVRVVDDRVLYQSGSASEAGDGVSATAGRVRFGVSVATSCVLDGCPDRRARRQASTVAGSVATVASMSDRRRRSCRGFRILKTATDRPRRG